jgi:hypothetical protein
VPVADEAVRVVQFMRRQEATPAAGAPEPDSPAAGPVPDLADGPDEEPPADVPPQRSVPIVVDVAADPDDDDDAFREAPRRFGAAARARPEELRALHDRLAAIRKRMGEPGRRQPPA